MAKSFFFKWMWVTIICNAFCWKKAFKGFYLTYVKSILVYLTIVMNQPTKQQDKPIWNFHQFLCLSFANCVRFSFFKNSKCCKAHTLLPCQINISLFLCPLFKSFVSRFEKLSLPTHFIHFLKEAWILFGYSFQERLCNALHMNM